MEDLNKAKETTVTGANEVINSKFPIAEIVKENSKTKFIIEGSGNWFRLIKRVGKKEKILFTDGGTSINKFKEDCVKYLPITKEAK